VGGAFKKIPKGFSLFPDFYYYFLWVWYVVGGGVFSFHIFRGARGFHIYIYMCRRFFVVFCYRSSCLVLLVFWFFFSEPGVGGWFCYFFL
jgi:hypothetical protein